MRHLAGSVVKAAAAAMLAACSSQPTSVSDASKVVRFSRSLIWQEAPYGESIAVRFPQGEYRLEAEDWGYRYFRAPIPLELRELKGDQPVSGGEMPGGLMLAKRDGIDSGAAYIYRPGGSPMPVLGLGAGFFELEQSAWVRTDLGPPATLIYVGVLPDGYTVDQQEVATPQEVAALVRQQPHNPVRLTTCGAVPADAYHAVINAIGSGRLKQPKHGGIANRPPDVCKSRPTKCASSQCISDE